MTNTEARLVTDDPGHQAGQLDFVTDEDQFQVDVPIQRHFGSANDNLGAEIAAHGIEGNDGIRTHTVVNSGYRCEHTRRTWTFTRRRQVERRPGFHDRNHPASHGAAGASHPTLGRPTVSVLSTRRENAACHAWRGSCDFFEQPYKSPFNGSPLAAIPL